MSFFLRYLCLLAHSGVQHIVFLFCLSSSCVPYVASFSGLPILFCPFGILYRLFTRYREQQLKLLLCMYQLQVMAF
jgi:hypothetical protein